MAGAADRSPLASCRFCVSTMETSFLQSPLPLEPQSKKQKMPSTTATDSEEGAPILSSELLPDQKIRFKRRKIAIILAYCGVGYQGMQKNPGAKTIEGDLDDALFQAGAVSESDRCNPKRYDWARSARTDKGVSAVGQVVSGRFYIDPPGLVDRLNSHLPPQIRILGFKRVTNSFSAKKHCDRRRYVYLLPAFALDPTSHPDRESVIASVGSENELTRCTECSERGRKNSCIISPRNGESPVLNADDDSGGLRSTSPNNPVVEASGVISHPKPVQEENEKKQPVPLGDSERERFNQILGHYGGTHNFHNFTTRTKADDPSACRYIASFTAGPSVSIHGMDFIPCEVVGQSFMLHQIRKMIGLAVAVMRNCAPESIMQTAFRKEVSINVPTAPELGLYLDECVFYSYNKKWEDSHEAISMDSYIEEAEKFKMQYIYTHIASTEQKEGTVGLWLHSLNHRNYPDIQRSNLTAVITHETTTEMPTNSTR